MKDPPGRYQELDLFIKVLRLLCPNLTDASSRRMLSACEVRRPSAGHNGRTLMWASRAQEVWESSPLEVEGESPFVRS